MKVILCLFGVIPRSIKYTFKSIKENIINVLLENNHTVDIYVFNLNIKNAKIDGIYINNNDIKLIPYNFYEEYDQEILDIHINKIIKNFGKTFTRYDYTNDIIHNCFRQLYSENRVGEFLEKNANKYDMAIVCGPDFFIANKLNINEIVNANNNNNFYTTVTNDAQGYSNGFYFGKPNILIKPLKRLSEISKFLPTECDYEYVLKKSIETYNIVRNVTSLYFFKIRANKNIFFRHPNYNYINIFSDDNYKKIVKKYELLVEELKKL